jgi:hypothetical protein
VSALHELAAVLRADGGLLAGAVRDAPRGAPLPEGPRAEVRFLLEAIREGEQLHYGTPRVVDTPDADLALLAGDRLYALGLERLAAIGDLEAVAELADVIALCAQAHAEGDEARAQAVWDAGAAAVAGGPAPDHQAAKRRWRGA